MDKKQKYYSVVWEYVRGGGSRIGWGETFEEASEDAKKKPWMKHEEVVHG